MLKTKFQGVYKRVLFIFIEIICFLLKKKSKRNFEWLFDFMRKRHILKQKILVWKLNFWNRTSHLEDTPIYISEDDLATRKLCWEFWKQWFFKGINVIFTPFLTPRIKIKILKPYNNLFHCENCTEVIQIMCF